MVHREAAFYANVFGRHGLVLEDLGSLESFGHVHPRLPVEAQARQRMLKATKAGAV